MKRFFSLTLAAALMLSGCTGKSGAADDTESFTYRDSVVTLAANWNPHTYETADDSYPDEFIRSQLYTFIFNDELHPMNGRAPYEGYVILPEMAASVPVDVTETVKREHPEFRIPASAASGYAYTIDLNPAACWEDGTPINADTYVYSMGQLLDPERLNYRASDFYAGELSIAGAELYANQGRSVKLPAGDVMANEAHADIAAFLAVHGDAPALINWQASFGGRYDFAAHPWNSIYEAAALVAAEDALTDSTLTLRQMHDFFIKAAGEEGESRFLSEVSLDWSYPSGVEFSSVGLYRSGEYQITLVLDRSLAGFNLLYSLSSGNWIVYPELYEKCLRKEGDAWFSTYNTSADTTVSYGPYRMVSYQSDKSMRFEKNPAWYGWTDGRHRYIDPVDGREYPMYQTTAIETQVVAEAATRKMMFLRGELASYSLQSEDFAAYKSSEFAHVTPGETLFFLILNGYRKAIENREASGSFDKSSADLETMMLKSFRQAVALTYDKSEFAAAISPARSAGYGLIGDAYLYDPANGLRYRDTDAAKRVLCDFYSVDVSRYPTLDAAVGSITGYAPETAKMYYRRAFEEALAAGYITDADGNGVSDQTVTIEYTVSTDSDFMTKTIDYLNEKMREVTVGTPFEGKIRFVKSAPYGTEWPNKLKSGLSDTVLGGWNGSALNPFSLTDLYTNPAYQYDAKWFDASGVRLTLTVNTAKMGESPVMRDVTMSLAQWSDALNGETVRDYNFGDGIADVETRLEILAAMEGAVLQTYNYIPMLQDASVSLLSKQLYYVVDDYNPVMGRGGFAYLRYNYDDGAWADYVASEGGELRY
ncbi:MAG: hypothetical protein E7632_09945 [Ruminococcaceae bacterium]|nr:hypothetical protein [Oscillospiraceae bacterium]